MTRWMACMAGQTVSALLPDITQAAGLFPAALNLQAALPVCTACDI
jgi:hypothetical protein